MLLSQISIDKILPVLEAAFASRPASELVIEQLKELNESKSGKESRLSYAVEEEVDSVHEVMEMAAADVADGAHEHEILVDKSKDSSRKSSAANSDKEAEVRER